LDDEDLQYYGLSRQDAVLPAPSITEAPLPAILPIVLPAILPAPSVLPRVSREFNREPFFQGSGRAQPLNPAHPHRDPPFIDPSWSKIHKSAVLFAHQCFLDEEAERAHNQHRGRDDNTKSVGSSVVQYSTWWFAR